MYIIGKTTLGMQIIHQDSSTIGVGQLYGTQEGFHISSMDCMELTASGVYLLGNDTSKDNQIEIRQFHDKPARENYIRKMEHCFSNCRAARDGIGLPRNSPVVVALKHNIYRIETRVVKCYITVIGRIIMIRINNIVTDFLPIFSSRIQKGIQVGYDYNEGGLTLPFSRGGGLPSHDMLQQNISIPYEGIDDMDWHINRIKTGLVETDKFPVMGNWIVPDHHIEYDGPTEVAVHRMLF